MWFCDHMTLKLPHTVVSLGQLSAKEARKFLIRYLVSDNNVYKGHVIVM